MNFPRPSTATPAMSATPSAHSQAAVWEASFRATTDYIRLSIRFQALVKLPFADNSNPSSWASQMRRDRLAQFLALLPPTNKTIRLLDVGGTEGFWASFWDERCERLSITLLNVENTPTSGQLPIESVVGDARNLSRYAAREFDFCFSNSVIEHVGTLADQQSMANEIRRVAAGYFVQTPYRYFPIEAHFHVPAWAQLPLWWRTALHRRMNLGWMPAQPDYLEARIDVEQIRLLSLREFRALFNDSQIRLEKVGPFIKSLIAIRAGAT